MYFEASSSTDLQFNPNSDTLSVAIGQLFNLSGPRFPLMTKKKKGPNSSYNLYSTYLKPGTVLSSL